MEISNSSETSVECSTVLNPAQILEIALSVLVVVSNISLLAAMVNNVQKLRRNVLNLHAANILFVSTIVCVTTLANTFSIQKVAPGQSYSWNGSSHSTKNLWIGFVRGLYLSMTLSTSWSNLLLLHAVRRHSDLAIRLKTSAYSRSTLIPRSLRNAWVTERNHWSDGKFQLLAPSISMWMVSFMLAVAVPAGWNCGMLFVCLEQFDQSYSLLKNNSVGCSVYWAPLRDDYLITVTVLWLVCNMVTIALGIQTVKRHCQSAAASDLGIRRFSALSTHLKGSILLSILSFTGYLPLLLLMIFIPAVAPTGGSQTAINVAKALTYSSLVPQSIVLVSCFSGIKTAFLSTFLKCHREVNAPNAIRSREEPDEVNAMCDGETELINLGWANAGPMTITPEEENMSVNFPI